ncbi:hypothetical protein CLOM_g4827 [Closterium sp. NIES-68]|nr:hypothetical protein CLOM_g4827 [Closterium sp. NIES-68]
MAAAPVSSAMKASLSTSKASLASPLVSGLATASIARFDGLKSASAFAGSKTTSQAAQLRANSSAVQSGEGKVGAVRCEQTEPGMKLVFVSAEVAPWSKTGGLGDVLGGLPPALAARGHRVMTVSPRYDQYKDAWDTDVIIDVKVGDAVEKVRFFHCYKRGVDRVFVDHPLFLAKVYGKTGSKVYGPKTGVDYDDNVLRFSLFNQAALMAPKVLRLDNNPYYSGAYGEDVVFVANDWHTGVLPAYLKQLQQEGQFRQAKVAFCTHNIAYQGRFAPSDFDRLNLPDSFRPSFAFTDGTNKPMETWITFARYLASRFYKNVPEEGYGTYLNSYGFGEFTQATATWLQTTQLEHLLRSPFIGLSLDESTDRCRGKHMIVFATFLRERRVVTEYLALLTVDKADAASLLALLLSHLQAIGVDLHRISGISTDGAAAMMGAKSGLVTRLRLRIPHLVSCHCIAHRKALAAKTAADELPAFMMIDNVIRELAEFLGRSGPWHQRFLELHDVFLSTALELQGIHHLDISTVHSSIARVKSLLLSRYVNCGDDFNGAPKDRLTEFLTLHGPSGSRRVTVEGVYSDGRPRRFSFILHMKDIGYPGEGKHDDCVTLCMAMAEGMANNLEERLGDLKQLSGVMLFCADQWPLLWARAARIKQCIEWFHSLVLLYHAEGAEEVLPGIDTQAAVKEIPHFTPVIAALPQGEKGFFTGLSTILKTPDWEHSYVRNPVTNHWVKRAC